MKRRRSVDEAKSPAVEHGDKKKSKVDEEDTEKEPENDNICHQGQEKECKSHSGHNRPCRLRIGHHAPDFEVEGVANGSFASFSLSQYSGIQTDTFIFI